MRRWRVVGVVLLFVALGVLFLMRSRGCGLRGPHAAERQVVAYPPPPAFIAAAVDAKLSEVKQYKPDGVARDIAVGLECLYVLARKYPLPTPTQRDAILSYARSWQGAKDGASEREVIDILGDYLARRLAESYYVFPYKLENVQREALLQSLWGDAVPAVPFGQPHLASEIEDEQRYLFSLLAAGDTETYDGRVHDLVRSGYPKEALRPEAVRQAVTGGVQHGTELGLDSAAGRKARREMQKLGVSYYQRLPGAAVTEPDRAELLRNLEHVTTGRDFAAFGRSVQAQLGDSEVRKLLTKFAVDSQDDGLAAEVCYCVLSSDSVWRNDFLVACLNSDSHHARTAALRALEVWGPEAVDRFWPAISAVLKTTRYEDVEENLSPLLKARLREPNVGIRAKEHVCREMVGVVAGRLGGAGDGAEMERLLGVLDEGNNYWDTMASQVWAECERDLPPAITICLWRIIMRAGCENPEVMRRALDTARRRGQTTTALKAVRAAFTATDESLAMIEEAAKTTDDREAKTAAQGFIEREMEWREAEAVGGYVLMISHTVRGIRRDMSEHGPLTQHQRQGLLEQVGAVEAAIGERMKSSETTKPQAARLQELLKECADIRRQLAATADRAGAPR